MTYHLKIREYPARDLILVPCVLAYSRLYVYWGWVGGLRKVDDHFSEPAYPQCRAIQQEVQNS